MALVVLTVSCGAGADTGDDAIAAPSATSTQVPPVPDPGPVPDPAPAPQPQPQPGPVPDPAPAPQPQPQPQPGPVPQPRPDPAPAPQPDPNPNTPPDPPPAPQPDPDPVPDLNANLPAGVGLDIPDLNSDLGQRDGWEADAADACDQAGLQADCVTFAYDYFATDDEGRGRTPIDDPGTDYGATYTACPLESITPPTGEGTEPIPVGTEILIVVVCLLPVEEPDAGP